MPREVLTAIGLGLSMLVGALAGSFGLIILLHFFFSIRPTFQLFIAGGAGGFIVGGVLWKLVSVVVGEIIAYRSGHNRNVSPDEN